MGYFDSPVTEADGMSDLQRAIQLFRSLWIEERQTDSTGTEREEKTESELLRRRRELAKLLARMPANDFDRYIEKTEHEWQKN